jgi:HK97 family phage portal protein
MFARARKSVYNVLNLRDERGWGAWLGYATPGQPNASEQAALQVQAVFCAVRVIAEGVAQMPLAIKRQRRDGGRAVIEPEPDHWAQTLLTRRPNGWQSPYEFMEYAVMIAALCGDFVAIKDTPRRPKELLPIPPGNWSVRQDNDLRLIYRVSYSDKTSDEFPSDYVLHLRGPSLNAFEGARPVLLARAAIGLAADLEAQQRQTAGQGGRPSGILSTPTTLNAESRDRLRAAWQERFGARGEGGVAVLDGGWAFTPMQMTAVDSQHLETRKHQIEEIARAFRVFPQMLMQSDKSSTFASAESFFRAHVVHTLGPWIERVEGAINRDILRDELDDGLFADLDEENLMRGDLRDQADYFTKALGAGGTQAWMTPNEVRARRGLNPVEGGDRLSAGSQDRGVAVREGDDGTTDARS